MGVEISQIIAASRRSENDMIHIIIQGSAEYDSDSVTPANQFAL